MSTSSVQPTCRLCGADMTTRDPVVDLGDLAVSTFPQPDSEVVHAPLALAECPSCTLVQLTHTVDPQHLFRGDYWYASGINGTMREELRNIVRDARGWVRVHDGDWVIDIGANDGTLLSAWREHLWEGKPYRMAVEPSPTFQKVLADTSEVTVQDTFPCLALAGQPSGTVRVITSIAMFYAVPDPVAFATEVARLLTPDGIWVVQMQDLRQMVDQTAFDNICHEHLTYYDVKTFWEVCVRAGLRILSYSPREINGGSLRFIVGHADNGQGNYCPAVQAAHQQPIDWDSFAARVDDRIDRLKHTVAAARDQGHTVDLLGASTKGNTLLQLAGLGPAHIRRCWERHPKKVGRTTITGIPIVHETQGRGGVAPDLLVCPIWQFREALIEREDAYLKAGGRIYFPLPAGELYCA